MEIVVTGRHVEVPERFRRHLEDKLEKVAQLAPRAQRLDVEVSHETNRRQSQTSERVEITVRDKGPVIRAEACADDQYAALDLAYARLLERLRRARDRRKEHHARHGAPTVRKLAPAAGVPSADGAAGGVDVEPGAAAAPQSGDGAALSPQSAGIGDEDCPVTIRQKLHRAAPVSLDQALYEMELVGHDFFLFVEAETQQPSVVYRRRGWSYGVIRLDVVVGPTGGAEPEAGANGTAPAPARAPDLPAGIA